MEGFSVTKISVFLLTQKSHYLIFIIQNWHPWIPSVLLGRLYQIKVAHIVLHISAFGENQDRIILF